MKKLCEFSTVWADRDDLGSTETTEQKLKYATFEGVFSAFQGQKKVLNFFKIYFSIGTKKLHNMKLRKI